MKRYFEIFAALFLGTTMMFSCQQAEEPTMDQGTVPQTRAYGDTPVVAIYVETNDTNPLNAGDYMLSNGKPFAGIVELFASNIHKRTVNGVVEPTRKRRLSDLRETVAGQGHQGAADRAGRLAGHRCRQHERYPDHTVRQDPGPCCGKIRSGRNRIR